MKKRPWINENGVTHPMAEEQYEEYLREMNAVARVPSPEERISVMQGQLDDLTLLVADMVGGAL